MAIKQIEKHHEIDVSRRIADVRPWGTKAQEWLSDWFNYLFILAPAILVSYAIPAIFPIALIVVLITHLAVMSKKNILPYRYPTCK